MASQGRARDRRDRAVAVVGVHARSAPGPRRGIPADLRRGHRADGTSAARAPWRRPGTRRSDPMVDWRGLAGQRLVVGRATAAPATHPRAARRSRSRPGRSADGSSSGRMTGRGRRSRWSMSSRVRTALGTSTDVVRRATMTPDGRRVFEFRVDARRPERTSASGDGRSTADATAGRVLPSRSMPTPVRPDLVHRARLERRRTATWPSSRAARWPAGRASSTGPAAVRTDRRSGARRAGRPGRRPARVLLARAAASRARSSSIGRDGGVGDPEPDAGLAVVAADAPTGAAGRATRPVPRRRDPPRPWASTVDRRIRPVPRRAGSAARSGRVEPAAPSTSRPGWLVLGPDGRVPLDGAGAPPVLRHVRWRRPPPLDEVVPMIARRRVIARAHSPRPSSTVSAGAAAVAAAAHGPDPVLGGGCSRRTRPRVPLASRVGAAGGHQDRHPGGGRRRQRHARPPGRRPSSTTPTGPTRSATAPAPPAA